VGPGGSTSCDNFRARLLEVIARRATPRARAANAAAAVARASKVLARVLHAVPDDALSAALEAQGRLVPDNFLRVVVAFLTGWRGGTLAAAKAEEAADEAGGGPAARAAAIEADLPAQGSIMPGVCCPQNNWRFADGSAGCCQAYWD